MDYVYVDKMNFFSLQRDLIEADDYVIVYISPEDLSIVKIKTGGIWQNKLGRFSHDEVIGQSFGTQIWSTDRKKQVHVLRPTPELWTRVLPHRTQIIYMPDITFIIEQLEICPGSVVIESGTGSGSFSHSLARAIGRTGKLYTFDFHAERAAKASAEFEEHGLSDRIIASCRDVCNEGFGVESIANAVFLDLPSPWMAIKHAKQALRKDQITRIACFSPCMEQVQKTLAELFSEGFCELEMFEIVLRPIDVEERPSDDKASSQPSILISRPNSTIKGHTSYLYFASLVPPLASS